ncbi:SDR family NAD(P)-dependent oxidoreductase [Candidatus Poribacteria bacterium]
MSNGENMVKDQRLKGKSAIITGASSGIGKAAAVRLAQDGCNIFMVARRERRLQELKEEIASLDVQIEYAVGDVTNEDFAEKVVLQAHEMFGCLNILVLSAGNAFIRSFSSTSTIHFRSLMEVNSFGVVNFCKEGIKKMSPGGSIILITSPTGIYGAKGMSAYALSKGGIVAFGRCLALELAVRNIRVNIISPGFVETEMTQKLCRGLTEAQNKQIEGAHPLGIGNATDVANAISFLASGESSWITGIVLPVDGGFTLGK